MKQSTYLKRKLRIKKRDKVLRNNNCLRISFLKSNKHYYASLIECSTGNVLFSVGTHSLTNFGKSSRERIDDLATVFTKKIVDLKDSKMIFDRGVYRFHGVVKHFVEQIRIQGIKV